MLLFLGDIAFSWVYLLAVAAMLAALFFFWRWLLGRVASSKLGQAVVAGIITLLMLPLLYVMVGFIVYNLFNYSSPLR